VVMLEELELELLERLLAAAAVQAESAAME
jgi:hypothetical protein